MPFVSHMDHKNRIMHFSFQGKLTADELVQAFDEMNAFVKNTTTMVGLVAEFSQLTAVPPRAITYALNSPLGRYRPMMMVLVGSTPLIRSLASIFSRISDLEMHFFDDYEEAELFTREKIAGQF